MASSSAMMVDPGSSCEGCTRASFLGDPIGGDEPARSARRRPIISGERLEPFDKSVVRYDGEAAADFLDASAGGLSMGVQGRN